MNKTNILFRQHIDRGFKRLWKVRSQRTVIDMGIPKSLEQVKDKIVEATEFAKEPRKPRLQIDLPEQWNLKAKLDNKTSPFWHEEPILVFDRKTKLVEGIPQILVLLKTVLQDGLPPSVENMVGKMELPNQDDLVKAKIMQCIVWDGTQERLPKKLDIESPGFVFPRIYSIPRARKTINLQNQMLLLCALATSKHCTYLPRNKLVEPKAHVFIEKENEPFLFSFRSDYSVMSSQPLEPFGSPEETENIQLPNIFPLHQTINIARVNLYKNDPLLIVSSECHNPFLQSIAISHKSDFFWHQPQKIARGIAACFTFAVAQAQRIYGNGVRHLPKPVALHGICCDDKNYTVISYQLNTLNLDGTEGLKNQVWVDGPHQLYESCNDKEVINYNPEVIKKLIAIYTNGLL